VFPLNQKHLNGSQGQFHKTNSTAEGDPVKPGPDFHRRWSEVNNSDAYNETVIIESVSGKFRKPDKS